jgi:hypothetical protein
VSAVAGDGSVAPLVERVFLRSWSRWPLIIAEDRGGYLRKLADVNPGRLKRKFLSIALARVDNAGENIAACAKATSSAGVAEPMAALVHSGAMIGTGGGRSKFHRRVSGVRRPERTVWSLWHTRTEVASKWIWHPASQSWPMDTREWGPRSGTKWTWRASGGNAGMASSASWVECMKLPLGLRIAMGLVAMRLFWTCSESKLKKLEVVPVSARISGLVGGLATGVVR